jgi:two-component system, NtrC family, sensor histidine kinase AtoS
MTAYSLAIVILGLFIAASGGAFIWLTARRYRRELGLKRDPHEKKEDVSFIIDSFRDVTKQLKEKERELERLKSLAEQRAETVESYNENILQCVTNGVITFDTECRITTSNKAAEEILGIESRYAPGKSCKDIFGSGDICRLIRETLDRKQPSMRMEATIDGPGGRIWLGFNTALLTDSTGSGLGVILSFSDLTEVKRLQEQMELRERLTALGEMSAGIAHELRNPMAVITGYLSLLSKKTPPADQKIIRDVVAEINGMNRIIDDLLSFARPASLNRVPVNVKEMLEGCLSNVLQAKDAGSRIKTVLKLDDVETTVDEGLMKQAFVNLFQNAVEAIPDEGVITLEAAAGNKLTIIVRDTGTGIARDKIKKIFLPFFTTKDKGVGLGLALAHKIILSHGGRIEAESTEGEGTAFTVTLP